MKPEEILSNDLLVDKFSPRDIRTLTYLGYLGINIPKYKIMAQKIVEENKILFSLKLKGDKNIIIKSASEIIREQNIVQGINSVDAIKIGYAAASN